MQGIGEALALLSGFSYAVAYVCVAKGSTRARGDNGALLSVVMTALVAGLVWAPGVASRGLPDLADHAVSVGWFALSGILTIVWGYGNDPCYELTHAPSEKAAVREHPRVECLNGFSCGPVSSRQPIQRPSAYPPFPSCPGRNQSDRDSNLCHVKRFRGNV